MKEWFLRHWTPHSEEQQSLGEEKQDAVLLGAVVQSVVVTGACLAALND